MARHHIASGETGKPRVGARGAGVFFLVLVAASPAAAENALTITTEDSPPFNMPEGDQIGGLATVILKATLNRAGIPYGITLYPWARAYNMALHGQDTCVYSTTLTDARKPLFKWIGPLVRNNQVLFAKTARHITVHGLDDVRSSLVGGYLGDSVTVYLKEQGVAVEEVSSDALNAAKLDLERIDLWATGERIGRMVAQRAGVDGIEPVYLVRETFMYLACNPSVPDTTIGRANGALARLTAEGALDALGKAFDSAGAR